MATEDNFRFAEGDSLMCYHGPILYEAKCLKRRMETDGGNGAQYFIHYKGWNNKWDEWVNDDRILEVNTANMKQMTELKDLHSKSRKSVGKRSFTANKEIITTPYVKVGKHENSKTSLESIKLVNDPSPIVLIQKKRGRPFKTTNNTSEQLEINKEQKSSKVNEANKALDVVEEIRTDKVIKTGKDTVRIKSTNIVEAVKTQIEIVKITNNDNGDDTKAIDGTNNHGIKQIEKDVGIPMEIKIQVIDIPLIFKKRLSQDHIMIEKQKKMLLFSKYNTIDLLLRDYVYSTSKLSVKEQEISKGISLTLIQYFNCYIHTELLYDTEREKNIIKKARFHLSTRIQNGLINKHPVNKSLVITKLWHYVYGPSFLLRLLVKLPNLNLILSEKYDAEHIKRINEYFGYFLKYLEGNYEKYFSDQDYK